MSSSARRLIASSHSALSSDSSESPPSSRNARRGAAARRGPPAPLLSIEDLAIRIEWLEQALAGVPESWALGQLQGWTKALRDVHASVARVQTHARDPFFARLFAGEGALTAFRARLFVWCNDVTRDLESLAARLRRGEPSLAVLSFKAVSESYVRFQRLETSLRAAVAELRPARPGAQPAWKALEADVEELLWATEWLHMSLARTPGE